MQLKSKELQLYTATQSSTRGWKDCACSKTVSSSYTNVGNLQLTVANGNPSLRFFTFQEEFCTDNNGAGMMYIGWTMGWTCDGSNGAINNPTGNGACNFIPVQQSWNNSGSLDWSFWDVGTRTITWRSSSQASSSVNVIQRVMVYSERIDLITLSCV